MPKYIHTFKTFSLQLVSFCLLFTVFSVQANFSDRVLVIVNEDVISQSQLDYRVAGVLRDIEGNELELPPMAILSQQILDTMVSELLQVQEAERRGLAVSDNEIEAAITRFAAQQSMTVDEFKSKMLSLIHI